jgi:hypothetical protein
MQYTIEARELTNESTHRSALDVHSGRTTIEAGNADEAISRYVQDCAGELMSCSRPARGTESIATVKRQDALVLLRVYKA